MIVAVNGVQNADGNFEVSDYCLPGIPLQNDSLPLMTNDKYVKIKEKECVNKIDQFIIGMLRLCQD